MRHVQDVAADLPRAEVWARLHDPRHVAEWDPGIAAVEALDAGPPRVGSRYRVSLRLGLLRVPMLFRIETLEAPHHLVLRGQGRLAEVIDDVHVTPFGATTRVSWRASMRLKGPVRLATPLVAPWFQLYARLAMHGLRRWLASGGVAELV